MVKIVCYNSYIFRNALINNKLSVGIDPKTGVTGGLNARDIP